MAFPARAVRNDLAAAPRKARCSLAGFLLRVFNPAKTVADGFRFRNKIGLDVATRLSKESRRLKKASMDELWAAAKVCRVANVMGPYLESL